MDSNSGLGSQRQSKTARSTRMRDSGALPGRDELHAVCDVAGLDDRHAVLLHALSNAVYHLPRGGLVLRLAADTAPQVERARKVVAVSRWVAEHGGPALAPTDLSQPVLAASTVATVWPYLPPSTPDPVALGAALRELHAITAPAPPVPAYRPLTRLLEALNLDTARDTPALSTEQHAWLTDHADQLRAAYSVVAAASALDAGLIHGDAHTSNLLRDPATRRWVLIDFDHAAHGPRELDLLYAAPDHFHQPAADRDAFTRGYGHDLLRWPGWTTLRDISEAHSLASYIRRAPTTPPAAAELACRLHSLRTACSTTSWTSIN
jgi:Ser/Thr protein kinase RdoA (MazF antagonist)